MRTIATAAVSASPDAATPTDLSPATMPVEDTNAFARPLAVPAEASAGGRQIAKPQNIGTRVIERT